MLKDWKVKKLGPGKLGIECPHCGGKAVVNAKWAKPNIEKNTMTMIIGRSCTYCCKTAAVPARLRGGRRRLNPNGE